MKKYLLVTLACILCWTAWQKMPADTTLNVPVQFCQETTEQPKGFETLSVNAIGAAETLVSIPDGAAFALIQATGGNVLWRDGGTSPTTSVGMIIYSTDTLKYNGDLDAIEFCAASGTVTLNVRYSGP